MAGKLEILAAINVPDLCKELVPSLKPVGTDGKQALGLCPFHAEKKPSFAVRLTDGAYNCKSPSCGKHGTWVAGLLQAVRGLDFATAMNELEGRAGLSRSNIKTIPPKTTGSFEYFDAVGTLAYTKERKEARDGKHFVFIHLDAAGAAQKGRGEGKPALLYRLPEILQADTVYFTEGEKHADFLHGWNFPATSLDCGAQSRLTAEQIGQLAGKNLVILPDNDVPGRQYAENIAAAMHGKAVSIKVIPLPGLPDKGDVMDWQKSRGNDKAELTRLVDLAPVWTPTEAKPEQPAQAIPRTSTDADSPRAFPRCYLDTAVLLNDPRRIYFEYGQASLFDAFILRIGNAPGARYPNSPTGIARLLETNSTNMESIINTALNRGLLELDADGQLVNPMVSAWYISALKECAQNSLNGKVPKKPRKKRKCKTPI